MEVISLTAPFSLSLTASSTAIQQKGLVENQTLAKSTAEQSCLTLILAKQSTTLFTPTNTFISFYLYYNQILYCHQRVGLLIVMLYLLLVGMPVGRMVDRNIHLCPWFLPAPAQIQCQPIVPTPIPDICSMYFYVHSCSSDNYCGLHDLLTHYSNSVFKCVNTYITKATQQNQMQGFVYRIEIKLKNSTHLYEFDKQHQEYSFEQKDGGVFIIEAAYYPGIVRGLETFSQVFRAKNGQWQLLTSKVVIKDQPQFSWRGIMIDTSRHYLPISTIRQTIDSLMYAKMSIMHWHMIDQDSFPVKFPSHPQIAIGAAYSENQTYSYDDLKEVIRYAAIRGIKVVPELDIPSHASSWGRYTGNRDVACPIHVGTFMGSLDLTWERTYKVLKQVINDTLNVFPSKHIHLGADEFVLTCQKNKSKTSSQAPLQTFMQRIVNMVKQLDSKRKVLFWYNNNKIVEGSNVQWWGAMLPNLTTDGDIVLSYYPTMYLDTGVNNYLGWNYGPYNDWLELYTFIMPKYENIIGGQGPLWSQINNEYSQMLKLWPRTAAINMRLWQNEQRNSLQVLKQLVIFGLRLSQRDIPSNSLVSEHCEQHIDSCNYMI